MNYMYCLMLKAQSSRVTWAKLVDFKVESEVHVKVLDEESKATKWRTINNACVFQEDRLKAELRQILKTKFLNGDGSYVNQNNLGERTPRIDYTRTGVDDSVYGYIVLHGYGVALGRGGSTLLYMQTPKRLKRGIWALPQTSVNRIYSRTYYQLKHLPQGKLGGDLASGFSAEAFKTLGVTLLPKQSK